MQGLVLEERVLRRIIALLVSLAQLAECAAHRSLPVRWLILVLLRRAEAVSLTLLEGTVDLSGFDDPEAGYRPVDATILAYSLRTIATLLWAVYAVSPEAHVRDASDLCASSAPLPGRVTYPTLLLILLPQGAFDTS